MGTGAIICGNIEKEGSESGGFAKFLKAGFTKVEVRDGEVEIPDFLEGMLQDRERSFELS